MLAANELRFDIAIAAIEISLDLSA